MRSMNTLEATLRVAARKWSETSTVSWSIAAGILVVVVGVIAGISDQFEHKGGLVLICIGIFIIAVAAIVKAIQGSRRT